MFKEKDYIWEYAYFILSSYSRRKYQALAII